MSDSKDSYPWWSKWSLVFPARPASVKPQIGNIFFVLMFFGPPAFFVGAMIAFLCECVFLIGVYYILGTDIGNIRPNEFVFSWLAAIEIPLKFFGLLITCWLVGLIPNALVALISGIWIFVFRRLPLALLILSNSAFFAFLAYVARFPTRMGYHRNLPPPPVRDWLSTRSLLEDFVMIGGFSFAVIFTWILLKRSTLKTIAN